MIGTGRVVTFDCGHQAWRLAKDGRSLVGEWLHCDQCRTERGIEVVSEGPAQQAVGA